MLVHTYLRKLLRLVSYTSLPSNQSIIPVWIIISLEAIYNVFDPTAKTFCENRRLTIAYSVLVYY